MTTYAPPGEDYERLVIRINRYPQGAPPMEQLYEILQLLMSENDAALLSVLPIKPFNIRKAARLWKLPVPEAQKVMDDLASRGLMLDVEGPDGVVYAFPPPMAGFFEFAIMRKRPEMDQKALAGMYMNYTDIEGDFIRALYLEGDTQYARTLVQEPALNEKVSVSAMSYEKAEHIIRTASHIGVGLCYCRSKTTYAGQPCGLPLETCLSLNLAAASITRHGTARAIDAHEALDIVQMSLDRNMIQIAENVREQSNFICNCCSCCCEPMNIARKFTLQRPVHTTSFLAVVDESTCIACGKCERVCPIGAIDLVESVTAENRFGKAARVHEQTCLGCGSCVRNCPSGALAMVEREEQIVTPYDTTHRTVMMAIERGSLQDLVFDNQVLSSHRTMAAVLGAILKMPPVKRVLASQQVKSKFFEYLFKHEIVKMYPHPIISAPDGDPALSA